MKFKKPFLIPLILLTCQNLVWGQSEFPQSVEILENKIPVLTLQDCIDYAVKHADSILAAMETQTAATYRHSATKRKYLPEAYVDGNAGYNTEGERITYASANVFLPLSWGNLNAERRLASNNLERTTRNVELKINDAIQAVKDAYYRSLYSERTVMNLVGSLYQLEEHLRVVNALYRSGNALKVDVLKVQAQFAQEKNKLRKALGDQKYFKSFLNQLVDRPMDEEVHLAEEPFIPLALSLKEANEIADKFNPLFKILSAKKEEAEIQVQKAKWGFVKNFGVLGRYQRQDASYVAPDDKNEWILGLAANVSVWDWGKTRQEVQEKQAVVRSEMHEIENEIDKHRIQIKRLYEDLQIADQGIQAARETVRALEEEYAAQKVRFENGIIKTQDILITQAFLSQAHLDYEELVLDRNIAKMRLQSFVGVPDTHEYEGRGLELNDQKLLDLIARKAFNYFDSEYNKKTGLFFDAAGGGDASIGAMGYGFAALVIGAERGWIPREEAEKRILLGLDSLLQIQTKGGAKEGIFYHFIDPQTGARGGLSEISLIDTALLLAGAFTAAEYFQGEVASRVEKIYSNIHWDFFLSQDTEHANEFRLAWTPEKGFLPYYWNAYTDETLLIILAALGSDQSVIPAAAYRAFRRQKTDYAGIDFYPSWSGGLFSYQYANLFFDFNSYADPKNINWFENGRKAVQVQMQYLRDSKSSLKSVKEGLWGISAGELPNGDYDMLIGLKPNLMQKDRWNGIYVPSAVAGSLEYVPHDSLLLLRKLYKEYPSLWGKYGFTSSFAPDMNWFSTKYYGIDLGLTLVAIDNYQRGTVRRYFMKNRFVQTGLERAGFRKAALSAEKKAAKLDEVEQLIEEEMRSKMESQAGSAMEQYSNLILNFEDGALVSRSIHFYQDLLAKYKDDSRRDRIRFQTAGMYETLGQFQEAAKEYDRLIKESPESPLAPRSMENAAIVRIKTHQVKQAMRMYRRLANDYPETVYAQRSLVKLGELHRQAGRDYKAKRVWEEFIERYPDSDERQAVDSLLKTTIQKV